MSKDKFTKIIATISDKNCSEQLIRKLFAKGMNAIRINTAHQEPKHSLEIIKNARKVSKKIAVLLDTKGPEVRTTKVSSPIVLKKGSKINIKSNDIYAITDKVNIYVNYRQFNDLIPVGTNILIDDGAIKLKVKNKNKDSLICVVVESGILKSKKTINVPEVHLTMPPLTKKDKEYINFAIENKVDFIAHSFVRNASDVLAIQKILNKAKSSIKIIAKIENRQGIDNIEQILPQVYGIMIARGDMGVELNAEEVPIVQKEIIEKCRYHSKAVITATQMLESMIEHHRATRAEVSDVANAVIDGTDAVMLSGETAYGKYPIESVETMAKICQYTEKIMKRDLVEKIALNIENTREFLANSAIRASLILKDVKGILATAKTGGTVKKLSSFRPQKPIFVSCYSNTSIRELSLFFGVFPFEIKAEKKEDIKKLSFKKFKKEVKAKKNDSFVYIVSTPDAPAGQTNIMEVNTIDNFTA